MAEANLETPPVELPPVIPPDAPPDGDGDVSHETPPETPPVGDEGKPGGDSPQDVRARREYQARKRAEQQADAVRQENIRLSERLKVIEEERRRTPAEPAQKIYTIAELNAAVAAGNIAQADADRYVEEVIFPRSTAQVIEQREARLAERLPAVRAVEEINEYRKYLPFLNDRSSPEFQKIAQTFAHLVQERGLPSNEVTEALAVQLTHGSLESHRRKAELAAANATPRQMPSDAGGGAAPRSNGKVDISKAPDMMRHIWESTGTSQADREAEYKMFVDGERRRQSK